MFTQNDLKTITHLLLLTDRNIGDKLQGSISEDRKVTIYKIEDTITIDIRRFDQ